MNLTKKEAIAIFGSGAALGRAFGISKGAISQWPDELDLKHTDAVINAARRLGKPIPEGFDYPSTPSEEAE